MRIIRSLLIGVCVLLATQLVVSGQTKYGVTVRTVKPDALAKTRTYVWRVSQSAFNKNIDETIIAAVDRELTAHGLSKAASGPSDLVVSYNSVSRTDVDTKNNPTTGSGREFDVGTLVVDLNSAASRELLFRVRADAPIARDAASLEATINAAVTAMFEKYPSPKKR